MTRFIIAIYNKEKEFIRYFQKHPPEMFCKKDALKDFENYTGKHPKDLQLYLKETLTKFLKAPDPKNICKLLILYN